MKRVNWEIRLKTCGSFMSLAITLIITLGANQARAIHFPDYFPVDPVEHGMKTFEFAYGLTGQYTSQIMGTETVPYTPGHITGVEISNFWRGSTLIARNDGSNVRYLGYDDYYWSTDCSLTAHPSGWSFSTLTDGMLIDQGVFYHVKDNLSTCEMTDDQQILISIQNVTVLKGDYTNAVIFWYLDTDYPFTALNLYGKESDLGITLPTASDTGGYSVTDFGICASGVGLIADGDIDASEGSLNYLSELKEITPIEPLYGWIWMPPGVSDIGYSLEEGDLLHFYSWENVMSYNIPAGPWTPDQPAGWTYFDWPFYYILDSGSLMFALPPEGGLWVYHYSTGQWTVSPRIIP
jgi:hypothetical protein